MSAPSAAQAATPASRRWSLVALAAFGFTFALVPLYRIACEKVFGIRLERSAAERRGDAAQAATTRAWSPCSSTAA